MVDTMWLMNATNGGTVEIDNPRTMSTTTQDVLLSERIDELIRGGRSAGMITMMTWAGKALELEADRQERIQREANLLETVSEKQRFLGKLQEQNDKLLDLIRQGVAVAEDSIGWDKANDKACETYLSKVKEELPNL